MCDEITEADNAIYLENLRLSRRAVSVGGGAALAAMLPGCASPSPPVREPETRPPQVAQGSVQAQPPATASRRVTITTPDGTAEAFYATPSSGQHPGVLMWPDVAGLRPAYEAMATRLAGDGYAVLVVNPYYRSTKLPLFETFAEWRAEGGKEKVQPMRDALTADAIADDGAAYMAWLDQQPEVDRARKTASAGYCMGGPFTFWTAAAVPKRVGAVASFHGGGLVTDEASSPHRLLATMNAAALICIAHNDHEKDPEAKATLEQAAQKAQVPAEVEVYPAQHGFCTIDSPVYDQAQAERAWARMLATFTRHL